MLATFSDGYRSALASLRGGHQDPTGKLTELAIRWMEVTNWPNSLPARLSRNRLDKMAGQATNADFRAALSTLVRSVPAGAAVSLGWF